MKKIILLLLASPMAWAQPAPDFLCVSEKYPNYYAITRTSENEAVIRASLGDKVDYRQYKAVTATSDHGTVHYFVDAADNVAFVLAEYRNVITLMDVERGDDHTMTCVRGR